jgi:hypothetical protein
MTNEDLLQKTLTMTLERMAKQTMAYETEIANLNAQLLLAKSQKEDAPPTQRVRPSKQEKSEES